jgi:hypothetical protein
MKRVAVNIEKMPPTHLLHYMSEKQYPSLNKLIDQITVDLKAAIQENASAYPFLYQVEREFIKMAALVRKQISKNVRILFPFIDNAWEEGTMDREIIQSLEIEKADLHAQHIRIEMHLATVAEMRQRLKPGIYSSPVLKTVLAELRNLERQLRLQFYIEDELLLPKFKLNCPSRTRG